MGEGLAAIADVGSQFIGSAGSAVESGLTAAGDALGNLGSSFSAGLGDLTGAAGTGLETGIGTVGSGLGGNAASLADIVGSGAGLAGGATGLEGTSIAAGGLGDIGSLIGGGAGTALGTAESFMGAPGASGFNASAMNANPTAFGGTTASSALGTGTFPTSATLPSNVANANAGASVFDTGTSPVQGISSSGAPSAGSSASAIAAPTSVTGTPDLTAGGTATGTTGTAAGTSAAAPATGGSSSITDLLKNAGSGAIKSLTGNPIGTALGAAGLGYNILQGQKQSANQQALAADAKQATANSNQMVASGEALQQYLTNGTLPPTYQAQVDQAIQDAKTAAISNAAANGLPTDPTKNTALAQTLASIDNSRASMTAQVAQTLFSSGTSLVSAGQQAANLSGNLYQTLVQNDTASAANTGKAIATLAAALNGKSNNSFGNVNVSTG